MLTLDQKLKQFIDEALIASSLYNALASIAPNDNYKQLLMGMANDESDHAKAFQKIYQAITNQRYHPRVEPPLLRSSFDDILWNQVLEETSDYRKFDYEYIRMRGNSELASVYYIVKTDANVHAIRLLYMLLR